MLWKEELSVGIPEIDSDHRELADCVTEIEVAVSRKQGGLSVHDAIAKLISAAATHFDIEESLMGMQGYPEIDDHIAGHGMFLQLLQRIEAMALVEPLSLTSIAFLQRWLEEHFEVDDRDYAAYVSSRD